MGVALFFFIRGRGQEISGGSIAFIGRALKCRYDTIHVLVEVVIDALPERIQQEFDTFTSGQFCGGYKITVPGYENDGVHLLFECQRRDIESDTHIHPFLAQAEAKVVGIKASPCVGNHGEFVGISDCERLRNRSTLCMSNGSIQDVYPFAYPEQLLRHLLILDMPTALFRHLAKSKSKFALPSHLIKKFSSKDCFICLGELDLLV